MDFSIKFEKTDLIEHNFNNGKYEPYDASSDEPTSICGEILIDDKNIGSILLYELCNDENFYDLCDSVSGDLKDIASAICGKSGAILKRYLSGKSEYENVFILDKLSINKEYRNHGIGSVIMKNLPDMIRYQFDAGSTIFLCASDYESAAQYGFESEEYEQGKNRLIRFYKKFGYRVVKDNIMVYTQKSI